MEHPIGAEAKGDSVLSCRNKNDLLGFGRIILGLNTKESLQKA